MWTMHDVHNNVTLQCKPCRTMSDNGPQFPGILGSAPVKDNGHTMYNPNFYNMQNIFLSLPIPVFFAKKLFTFMITIYSKKKINGRCPEYFHTVDVKACEFGYKSWKFQILPILSAMQGSAPAHLLQYKYKYNKDVGTFCILTSCFEIFLDKAMRTPLTPYQNWRTITGLMS